MPCLEHLELMNAALDGEATAEEQKALEAHLAQCPDCRALYADLTALHDGADTLTVEAPAGFTDRVMEAVRAEEAPNVVPFRKKPARWRSLAALAAVCALVLLGTGPLGYLQERDAPAEADLQPFQADGAAPQDEANAVGPNATLFSEDPEVGLRANAAQELTPEEAQVLVVEHIQAQAGNVKAAPVYTGLSPNGAYHCFQWEEREYAVSLDGDSILWSGDGEEAFRAALND